MTQEFHEGLRYQLPLTPQSVVLDIGAYEGNFSKTLSEKYRCQIIAFEPVAEFYRIAKKNLEGHPNVRLFNLGVGGSTRKETFKIKGSMTSQFADGLCEIVELRDIAEVFDEFNIEELGCLKINAEGHEFEIIEAMLGWGLQKRVNHLSVQPHACVPDHESRWAEIERRMEDTHTIAYRAPWVWVGWDRK
jgi:FkbM family methyltransferase